LYRLFWLIGEIGERFGNVEDFLFIVMDALASMIVAVDCENRIGFGILLNGRHDDLSLGLCVE
jgi:hypothetical protein